MTTGRQVAGIVGLLALVGVLYVVAGHDPPPRWELDVVDAATRLPRVLGAPIEVVMQLGRRSLVPVIAFLALVITRRWHLALAIVVAGLATGWGVDRLKDWSGRPRPVGVRIRDHADGAGFPSGHTAIAFAVAVVVAMYVPARRRWLPLGLAAIVGISRMYVGAHYPLDVLGGAALGLAVGWAVVVGTTSLAAAAEGRRRARQVLLKRRQAW